MKLQYTLLFLILTAFAYGQKSTLYQNVNVRAQELKHDLNKAGDTLVLSCERTIYEVVLFNDDFERVIRVRDSEAKIPLTDVPVGRYIVEALLSDKLIVITLLRNEAFDVPSRQDQITDSSDLFGTKSPPKKEVIAAVEAPKEETTVAAVVKKSDLALAGKKAEPEIKVAKPLRRAVKFKKNEPKIDAIAIFKEDKKAPVSKRSSKEVDAARANRIVSTYWVEYVINNGSSSQKLQKLGDQEDVDRMIKKIEIDMKTKAGRLNELTVWTVFDPPKFVKHKRFNKTNFTTVEDESFSLKPYYIKVNEPENQ